MDIVASVLKYFGPALLNRMATSVGVDPSIMEKLVTGGVPAILAGILGKTSQPGGARILGDVLERQSANVLDNLSQAVGSGRQVPLVDEGRQAIGTLLGTGALGQLAGTLSKFAGTGIGNASTVLGMVMPGVLGTLGMEKKSRGLDAAGLANMLASQRDAITDAIPAGLRPLLSDTGLLDGINARAPASRQAEIESVSPDRYIEPRAPSSSGAPTPRTTAPARSGPDFGWPGWLIAIAASATMWWSVFGDRALSMVTGTPLPPVSRFVTAPDRQPERLMVGAADVAGDAAASLDLLRATLTGIRGEVTARLSLARLQDAAADLDRLRTLSAQLPPDGRRRFAALVSAKMDELNAALAAAQAAPAAGLIVRPAIDQLRTRLVALAK